MHKVKTAGNHEAWYTVSSAGYVTVSVRSSPPLKLRAVYAGVASLEFMWISSEQGNTWHFSPTILGKPAVAQCRKIISEDGKSQVVDVELGDKMFPASGLSGESLVGEFRTPAVHFDLPFDFDLWIFLFHSAWLPFEIEVEKATLKISHKSTEVTAQVETSNPTLDNENWLRANVSVHGDDFRKVWLTLRRKVEHASYEEIIGEVTGAVNSFCWKPTLGNFDTVLVVKSNVGHKAFSGYMRSLGLETKPNTSFGIFSELGKHLLLCDGPAINYTLCLSGEKRILGQKKDETKLTLGCKFAQWNPPI